MSQYRLRLSRHFPSLGIVSLVVLAVATALAGPPYGVPTKQPVPRPVMQPNRIATDRYYTLTTATVGTGTITKTPNLTKYRRGTSVSCAATGDVDNRFAGWSVDLSGSTTPQNLVMNAAKSITATFIRQWDIAVTTVGTGTVTSDPAGSPAWTYDDGTAVSLTATPGAGYGAAVWSGDTTATGTPLSIAALHADKAFTATFPRQFYGHIATSSDYDISTAAWGIAGNADWTIEAWCNPASTSGSQAYIGLGRDLTSGAGLAAYIGIRGEKWAAAATNFANGFTNGDAAAVTPVVGTAKHIAGTYVGSTRKLTCYVNGVFAGDTTLSGDLAINNNGGALLAVVFAGSPLNFVTGTISQARVWSIARTAEQITATMNTTYLGATAGLLCEWPISDASGQIVTDNSGNGINLQVGSTTGSDTNDPATTTPAYTAIGVGGPQ